MSVSHMHVELRPSQVCYACVSCHVPHICVRKDRISLLCVMRCAGFVPLRHLRGSCDICGMVATSPVFGCVLDGTHMCVTYMCAMGVRKR